MTGSLAFATLPQVTATGPSTGNLRSSPKSSPTSTSDSCRQTLKLFDWNSISGHQVAKRQAKTVYESVLPSLFPLADSTILP